MSRYEKKMAIVGGGPIGLFLGICLARKSYTVSIFEKRKWPVDKVCGQGIMPCGHKLLSNLGLSLSEAFVFRSITYQNGKDEVRGILTRDAISLERKILSNILYQMALKTKNLTLYSNSEVHEVETKRDKVYLSTASERLSFDYLFACDGLHSKIRKLVNFDKSKSKNLRMGARFHCQVKPFDCGVVVYWNSGIEAYVTPVSEERIEIAFLWYKNKIEESSVDLQNYLINQFPMLKEKIPKDSWDQDFKAYGYFSKKAKGIQKKNIFFVGDAYYFLDGITGEGLSLGFKSAFLLSRHFNNSLVIAKIKIRIIYLNYTLWTGLALLMSRNDCLRKYAIKLLSKVRGLFNKILALNDLNIS